MVNQKNKHAGFTLIEMAVVLVIIGILIGSFIGTFANRIEVTRRADTKKELDEIQLALFGYAYTNGYLPCPDDDDPPDGIEDRSIGRCDTYDIGAANNNSGTLPWVTLGMGSADAWNIRYSYWVDRIYSDESNAAAFPAAEKFDLSSADGVAVIQEPDYVASPDGSVLGNMATNVVAVVISHGKNTLGGINISGVASAAAAADELENTNNGVNFVSRPPSPVGAATAGGEFDDIVIWISEYELKAKMVEAGKLP